MAAAPADGADDDAIDLAALAPWLVIAVDARGNEHAVLSDGWHRIRLDVTRGSLMATRWVHLRYDLSGVASAGARILPLRRLLHLCRRRQFAATLFPPEPHMQRWLEALRVGDALADGASQREIAGALFGDARIDRGWPDDTDALRSRVRRLVRAARAMAAGGWRGLMR